MKALVLFIVLIVVSPTLGEDEKETTNSIGMQLILISPGTFTMASHREEVGKKSNDEEVTINNPFYLSMFEVTQGEYLNVMGDNPSKFKGARNPVERVSWDDAVSFCKKLSELPEEKAAGRQYRLPTEVEWEYSCRGGSQSMFSFGDSLEELGKYAWFNENSGSMTHPVGQKKANAWGLYDMHGNVLEWCQDVYINRQTDAEPDPQGPRPGKGPSPGLGRVSRGGGWNLVAGYCRSARRSTLDSSERFFNVGFRIAQSLPIK